MGKTIRRLLLLLTTAVLGFEGRAGAVPPLSVGGRITATSGQPVAGPVDLRLRFYDAATDGNQLGADVTVRGVALADGVFQVPVALDAVTQAVFAGASVWLEVTDATHGNMYPRLQFNSVPYALRVPVDGTSIQFDANGVLTAPAPATANAVHPGFLAASDWTQFNAAPTKAYVDATTSAAFRKDGSVPLTGNLNAGSQDLTNIGNVTMNGSKTFGLSVATSDPAGLGAGDVGRIWYNGGIRLWNGTSAQSLGISGAGVLSLNGLNQNAQSLANGTTGTAPAWVSAVSTHTLNIPSASAGGVTQGLISNGEWVLFNGKQNLLPAANAVTNGYLSGGDWTVFNSKQPLLPPSGLTANGYLASGDWAVFNAKQNALGAATSGGLGYLTAGDWTTFNGREPAVGVGSASQYYRGDKSWQTLATGAVPETSNLYYTTARAQADARSAIGASGPLQYVSATGALALPPATLAANGYLASADWALFNGKQPLMAPATVSANGYLASGDWALFNAAAATSARWDGGSAGLNAANGRTSLALGNAATLTAGTTANNLVQLDGSARLPNVDATQILALAVSSGMSGGRLTLSSSNPTPQADITGATALYYLPYTSDLVGLNPSGTWTLATVSATPPLPLSGLTTSKNYDVFLYSNAGTPNLELSVWFNDTVRASPTDTPPTRVNGVYVKNGDSTRRYLGTIRATGATTTEDSNAHRFVWNYYNRIERASQIFDSATVTWTYAPSAKAAANSGNANWKIDFVAGFAEDQLFCEATSFVFAPAGNDAFWGVGIDSVTPSGNGTSVAASGNGLLRASTATSTTNGYHYCQAITWTTNGSASCTYYGNTTGSGGTQHGSIKTLTRN